MSVSKKQLDAFEEDGFLVLRNFWNDEFLIDLEDGLQELGSTIIGKHFNLQSFTGKECAPKEQSLFYDRLKYSPDLARMSGSKEINSLCKALNIKHPHLMGCCNMRLDKPNGTHLFEWHQDTVYLLGSINAVTIWFPVRGPADLHHGTIQVIPGSHKRGILPFKKISNKCIEPYVPFFQRDLSLNMTIHENPVHITADKGDVVIFKQMLLHKSTQNFSDQIRWTGQIRVTDLSEDFYKEQCFPTGDKTNIFHVNYPGFKYNK